MTVVVFDIGNVLLKFSPWEYLRSEFGAEAPLDLLHAASFGSSHWSLLDRGALTQDQAKQELQQLYPHVAGELNQIFCGWMQSLAPIQGGVDALNALASLGFKLYALSNFHAEAFTAVTAKHDWFRLFDGCTISAHIGCLKPEAGMYQRLLDDYGLAGHELLFLDDLPANVQSARYFGMDGLVVQEPERLITQLETRLAVDLRP